MNGRPIRLEGAREAIESRIQQAIIE
jgi:hypothetical protein